MMESGRGCEGAGVERAAAEHHAVTTRAAHGGRVRVLRPSLRRHHALRVRGEGRRRVRCTHRRVPTREFVDSGTSTSANNTTVSHTTVAKAVATTVVAIRNVVLCSTSTSSRCTTTAGASRGTTGAATAGAATATAAATSVTTAIASYRPTAARLRLIATTTTTPSTTLG